MKKKQTTLIQVAFKAKLFPVNKSSYDKLRIIRLVTRREIQTSCFVKDY